MNATLGLRLHALNRRLGTAALIREDEEYAELHSPTLGERAVSPREAVLRLAIHRPDVFEAFRA